MRQCITVLYSVLLITILAMPVYARPDFVQVIADTYKPYSGPLTERSCATCHMSATNMTRNPFGAAIEKELKASGKDDLTPAVLHKVEALDSDGDGVSNLDEIKAGANPGDPKSVPAKEVNAAPTTNIAKKSKLPSWAPSNAMHPAVVHFPIALFLAGLFLDFLGMIRKNRTLLFAGWYNLVLAAVSSLGAVVTGIAAMTFMHFPLTGIVQRHFILAICCTVLMWAMVSLRLHRHENISAPLRIIYYVLAAANMILISIAGHIGGSLVYG